MYTFLIIIVIVVFILGYEKIESKIKGKAVKEEGINTTNTVMAVVVLILLIIIFSAISGNIKDSNERKQAYDEYRKSTGKTNMTNTEVNKAMMEEAKWKSEMERKVNNN